MRDPVTITFGGRDYTLSPTFGVADAFEGRHGSLAAHLLRLVQGAATLEERGFLILQGLKYADNRRPDGTEPNWSLQATKEAIWEAGMWADDLVQREIEFVEKLLYTPEQFLEKKTIREKAAKVQAEAEAALNAFSRSQL